MKLLNKCLIFIFGLLTTVCVNAAVPAWQIVPDKSSLTFTGTQNGAPVTGKFTKFSGEINADPNQLSASHIKIVVDLNSVSDPSGQLAEALASTDWFNVKIFPEATFKSTEITKTGDKTYQAKGTLSIRDKTLPIVLNFTQEEYSPNKARVQGSTTIKRSDFGIGQGEWASTDEVKDEVKVDFVLTAVRK